jgi:hypothetical protein
MYKWNWASVLLSKPTLGGEDGRLGASDLLLEVHLERHEREAVGKLGQGLVRRLERLFHVAARRQQQYQQM